METSARQQPERQCCSRHGTGLLRSYSSSSVSNFLIRHNNEELLTYHPPALIVAIIALTYIHRKRRYARYQRVQDYYVEQMKCVLLLFPALFSVIVSGAMLTNDAVIDAPYLPCMQRPRRNMLKRSIRWRQRRKRSSL